MPAGTRSGPAPRKARTPKPAPQEPADDATSARLIELRSHPRSFAYIAKELDLGRARDAFDAFLVALESRTPAEQKRIRTEESARLDNLERRTRRRALPEQLDRKLASIAALRNRLKEVR